VTQIKKKLFLVIHNHINLVGSIAHCWTILHFWVNLSFEPYVPPIPVFLQYNWHYKSLLLTFFFCFCTVNLELLTCTYSLFRESFYL